MTVSSANPPCSAPRGSFAPLANCFRVAAGVASAAAWRPRRTGSWRGTGKESGWISCGTGTCGSSSAASRFYRSAILRWRPAGNWWPQSTGPARRPGPGGTAPEGSRASAHLAPLRASPPRWACGHFFPPSYRCRVWGSCTSRALALQFPPFSLPDLLPCQLSAFVLCLPGLITFRV